MSWNARKPDLEKGQRFTHLTVVRFVRKDERGRKFYLCRCDCGVRKIVQATLLRNGNTKSCGCKTSELKTIARTLPNNGASVGQIMAYYRGHAKKWNRPFELTRQEFEELIRMPCHYCGVLWSNRHVPGDFRYNGVDRIDSSLGYTVGNVVPCCVMCNLAKRNWSQARFLAWIKRVARHQWGGLSVRTGG